MAKRVSRKELKRKISDLTLRVKSAVYELGQLKYDYAELKKRFEEVGKNAELYETKGSGIECIEINPQPWGQYLRYSPDFANDEVMEAMKSNLVSQIAKGLAERNMVQFIVHEENDGILGYSTLGAKIYVVPWDRLVRKIIVRSDVNERKTGGEEGIKKD